MNLNLINQHFDYAAIQAKHAETSIENVFPGITTLNFHLPPELEASQPPEARGLARDQVRLMVSYISTNKIIHSRFNRLMDYLQAGDILVVNTSGTLNAALKAARSDGSSLELHLSTHLLYFSD